MAKVKSSLWSISNDPVRLQHVKVSGRVDDLLGSFSITQSYVTPKGPKPQDFLFTFHLFDIGTVTSFKATFAETTLGTECLLKGAPSGTVGFNPNLSIQGQELMKKHSEPSASDSFIAKIEQLPPETAIQFHFTFIQQLRMEGDSTLMFLLPTTISPKAYFHQEQEQKSSLREFSFELDVAFKMTHSRTIKGVRSPSHSIKYTSSSPSEGVISIADGEDHPDNDLFVLVDLVEPLAKSLPQAVIESHADRDVVMLTLCPSFEIPLVDVDEDDEEGHPDPREVLVVIDPDQTDFDEVKIVLKSLINMFDPQINFNFVTLAKTITRMFEGKAKPAFAREINMARKYIDSPGFAETFKNAKAENKTLTDTLKSVFDIDCADEMIPRNILLISKGHISKPATLFEFVAEEKGFSVFSLGLGVSSNFYVLNTVSQTGDCEIIYSSKDANEVEDKIIRVINRINQPNFEKVTVDWANLTKFMQEQTPSRDLPIHFWNNDILTIYGVTEKGAAEKVEREEQKPADKKGKLEKKPIEIKVEMNKVLNIKADPFKVQVEASRDLIKGSSQVERFQIRREREQPDSTQHVRMRKLYELAAVSGVATAGTVFFKQTELKGSKIVLVSASDTFLDDLDVPKPTVIKYDRSTLLKFQPHYTEKPADAILGEAERGFEIQTKGGGSRGRGGARRGGGRQQSAPSHAVRKQIPIATQWESGKLDEFFKSVNSLLNKLTPENYENLKTKLLAMKSQIETEFDALNTVVRLIFEKALISPRFVALYADLCQVLAQEIKADFMKDGKQQNFRFLLLLHCRENFEKCFTGEEAEGEKKGTPQEAIENQEKEFRRRQRLGHNIAFVGELFLRNLLRPPILHMIIRSLLDEDRQGQLGTPDAQQIELACKLFSTLGTRLEEPDSKDYTDRYFQHLEKNLAVSEKYELRTRFMIREIVETRANNWIGRGKPTTAAPAKPATPAKVSSPPSTPPSQRTRDREDNKHGGRGDRHHGKDDRPERGGGRSRGGSSRGQITGSARVDSRSDGWSERGGRSKGGSGPGRDYQPVNKNAPTGSARVDARNDGPPPGARGTRTTSPANTGRGEPKNVRGGADGGYSSRGGIGRASRGRGDGNPGGRGQGRDGNVSNAFALLHDGDGESTPSSAPASPAPHPAQNASNS